MGGWNVCTMVGNLKEMANASRYHRFSTFPVHKIKDFEDSSLTRFFFCLLTASCECQDSKGCLCEDVRGEGFTGSCVGLDVDKDASRPGKTSLV